MALLVTFVATDKSNPPEAQRKEKPKGGAAPRPYAPSTESVCVSHRADRAVRPTPGFPAANALSKPNRRPLAATYLCRFAAKARFDNRLTQGERFPKGRAAALPFGRFKGKRFLRKGGNRNPPFLKPFFGYFLSGKKVTRRRHKGGKSHRAGQSPAPTHVSRKPMHHTCGAMWASPPTYRLPKAYAYPTGRTEPSAPTRA